jgi:hypothetical protein
MSVDRQPCIVCDQLVAPGEGSQGFGPFPTLHSKCLLAVHESVGGETGELAEPINALLEGRRAIGRALNGHSCEVIFAAVGLLLVDVINDIKRRRGDDDQPLRALLLDQARDLGETIIAAVAREDR